MALEVDRWSQSPNVSIKTHYSEHHYKEKKYRQPKKKHFVWWKYNNLFINTKRSTLSIRNCPIKENLWITGINQHGWYSHEVEECQGDKSERLYECHGCPLIMRFCWCSTRRLSQIHNNQAWDTLNSQVQEDSLVFKTSSCTAVRERN